MSRYVTYGFNEKKEKVDVWNSEYINKEFQKVIYKDDIAVIYGNLSMTNGVANHNVNYPVGFNKDNCVVLTFMASNEENNNHWGYGYIENATGYVGGAIGHKITFRENDINVGVQNPTDGAHNSGTGTFNYKIVLMKLPQYDLIGMYKGDVNCDGVVDSNDLNIVKSYLEGNGSLTDKQYRLADCNGDGVIDSADLLKIQSVSFGYTEPELFTEEN